MSTDSSWRRELFDPLAWELSRRELHSLFPCSSVDQVVQAAFNYQGRGHYARIRPSQKTPELIGIASMVAAKRPHAIVELGTRKGGTLFTWSRLSPSARKIISVDLPGGDFGGGYHPKRQRLYREFVADRPQTEIILLQCDSQQISTRDKVLAALAGNPLEFLFIDADHRYDGVKRDFELYEPLVASGGLIGFHDILPHRTEKEYGVDVFWNEIKGSYSHHEFIQNPLQGLMGVGVLVKS